MGSNKKRSRSAAAPWCVVLGILLLVVGAVAKDLGNIFQDCEFDCQDFDPSSDSYFMCMAVCVFGNGAVHLATDGGTEREDRKMKREAGEDDPFSCEDHCREVFEPDSAKFRKCMRICQA
ncbi:hypothetical protein VPH35_114359 [Triticum aestivum]